MPESRDTRIAKRIHPCFQAMDRQGTQGNTTSIPLTNQWLPETCFKSFNTLARIVAMAFCTSAGAGRRSPLVRYKPSTTTLAAGKF